MYSDYLHVAWEAEKKKVMEPSHSQIVDSASKPKAMSFFPLRKLKGTQPTKTPVVLVAHLEEEGTNKEKGTESKDPNGIEGITKEAAQCTLSGIAHWWRHLEQTCI